MPWHSDFTHIRDVGLYTDIFPLKMPLSNAGRHFFKSYPDLSWFRYIIGSPIVNPGQDKSSCGLQVEPLSLRQRRMESDAEDRRRNRRCRRAIFFRGNEEWNRTRKIIVATDAAGGPFFFAATKIRIGRSRPSQQRKLVSDAAG